MFGEGGEKMAIELIGIARYEFDDGCCQGFGKFFLTKELVKKLDLLSIESEETIDKAVHINSVLSMKHH